MNYPRSSFGLSLVSRLFVGRAMGYAKTVHLVEGISLTSAVSDGESSPAVSSIWSDLLR